MIISSHLSLVFASLICPYEPNKLLTCISYSFYVDPFNSYNNCKLDFLKNSIIPIEYYDFMKNNLSIGQSINNLISGYTKAVKSHQVTYSLKKKPFVFNFTF